MNASLSDLKTLISLADVAVEEFLEDLAAAIEADPDRVVEILRADDSVLDRVEELQAFVEEFEEEE